MNPVAVAVAAYVFLGLEAALRGPLALGNTAATPSFMMILAVFLAVHGPARSVPWVCMLMGLLLDLIGSRPIAGGEALTTIIGPNALGFFAAAHAVLALRGVMMRRNPVAFLFLCTAATMLAHLVVVFVLTGRSWVDSSLAWSPLAELLARLGGSVYTGLASLVVGPLLHMATGLFGFADGYSRRPGRR
jgi:hypothetical protein